VTASTLLPATSGNTNIDALLAGTDHYWHTTGTTTVLHALTYSFNTFVPAYASTSDAAAFAGMNATQRAGVTAALTYISSLFNVTFTYVGDDVATANLHFATNGQGNTSRAYAYYPKHDLAGRRQRSISTTRPRAIRRSRRAATAS